MAPQREIKFREYRGDGCWHYWGLMEEGKFIGPCSPSSIALQFTGLLDKNGKQVYEGDIFRVEEADEEICDQCDGVGSCEGGKALETQCEHCNGAGIFVTDRIFYLVIVWVKEWAMFATLSVEHEYHEYIQNGVKSLDEPLFWTYTLEDTDSRKFFLCGNIFETPELLKQ